jgi:hypothetical protein
LRLAAAERGGCLVEICGVMMTVDSAQRLRAHAQEP